MVKSSKYIYLVSFLLFFSCMQKGNNKNETCDIDPQFKIRFEYYYNYMEDNYKKKAVVNGYMIRAIIFMSRLTKIESNVIFGDVTVYESYKDFKQDMSNWKKWYNQNKCKIDGNFIDNLESEVIQSTNWIEKPID